MDFLPPGEPNSLYAITSASKVLLEIQYILDLKDELLVVISLDSILFHSLNYFFFAAGKNDATKGSTNF